MLYLDRAYDALSPFYDTDYVYNPDDWDGIKGIVEDDYFLMGISNLVLMERNLGFALQNLRRILLIELFPKKLLSTKHLKFISALANNCLNNEYIYSVTENEELSLKKMVLDNAISVALFACYEPIKNKDIPRNLSGNVHYKNLIKVHVDEPCEEKRIRENIISLGSIQNEVSQSVQEMYEENPYPRWRHVDVPLRPYGAAKGRFLIAGCGTGRYACEVFTRLPNVEKIGIDISRSSLAYAKRMSEKYSVQNCMFYQCDILSAPEKLPGLFDVINCSGVLHHMATPMDGWRALLRMLSPGGVMTISLYSTSARKAVWVARDIIAKSGCTADICGIRKFRDDYFRGKLEYDFSEFENFRDFYSTSEVRDLLFHVQETTYNLSEIQEMLDSLGLEFISMKVSEKVLNDYSLKYSLAEGAQGVENWARYEQENPSTFANMYNFSCKRKGEFLNDNANSMLDADIFK
jgi:SAM-dependent methyltransferase